MRKIILLMLLGVMTVSFTYAQVSEKKLSKAEKKAARKQKEEEQMKQIIALLQSQHWVIEATTVYNRKNVPFQLNPTLNFFGVKGNTAALQLGFDQLVGWNGVGGITLAGKVVNYKLDTGKKGNTPQVTLRFQGNAGVGSAQVYVTVNASGQATARYIGDQGQRVTFSGQLVSLANSTVYKGQSLF